MYFPEDDDYNWQCVDTCGITGLAKFKCRLCGKEEVVAGMGSLYPVGCDCFDGDDLTKK